MTLGTLARRVLGPRHFSYVGEAYRRVFVDLRKVAAAIGPLPHGADVLDIGGGDGNLINLLLGNRPDLRVTMVDPMASVGGAIEPRYEGQVQRLPQTTLAEYSTHAASAPTVILISDVIHHVPPAERVAFLSCVRDVLSGQPCELFFKDMEPGYLRTTLGGFADRYISGDKNVAFMSRAGVKALVAQVFGPVESAETQLFNTDRPNYCLSFKLNPKDSG